MPVISCPIKSTNVLMFMIQKIGPSNPQFKIGLPCEIEFNLEESLVKRVEFHRGSPPLKIQPVDAIREAQTMIDGEPNDIQSSIKQKIHT